MLKSFFIAALVASTFLLVSSTSMKPVSCGGDVNARPGCGNKECGKRCSNYDEDYVKCPEICTVQGCECKPEYVFDDNIGKCVHPSKCTPVCCDNEVFVRCPDYSKPQNCSQLGYPLPIYDLGPDGKCPGGPTCVCIKGYLRNEEGECVPQSECPSCGGDPNAKAGCGSRCGRRCSNYKKDSETSVATKCATVCRENGCDCKPGFIYDDKTGKCVPPSKCTPECRANEKYVQCPDISKPQNCSQLGFPLPIPAQSPDGKCPGKPSCVCIEGHLRNSKGICVPQSKCPSCGGDPNAQVGCSQNCRRRCSNYNKGPVPCPKILCRINSCECKPDFVFDDNLGRCVHPSKCTQVCNANETYNRCPSISKPQNCSQLGYPLPLPKSNAGGQCQTKPACVCKKEGHVKNDEGICVPPSECPSCGGDPNAKVGCGANCGRHCSNYKNGPVFCPLACRSNSCICKPEFVYDDNIRKCVFPHECTPVCGKNEVFSDCTNGYCFGARNCTEKGKPKKCVKINPKYCKKGCICKEGYLWNRNGVCVPEDECETDTPKCTKPNEVFEEYPATCPARTCRIDDCLVRCMRPPEVGDPKCPPTGCRCARNNHTCPKNEVYDFCPAKCPFRTCGIDDTLIDCAPSPQVGDPDCPAPSCRCADGFYRNDKGHCVPWKDCPKCNKRNEVYQPCPPTCPPERCDVDERLIKCKAPPELGDPECQPGCRCADGFKRNKVGECIPKHLCPPVCRVNETYVQCPDISRPQNCSQLGYPLPIPAQSPHGKCPGKPSCVCIEGHLRNSEGICVPQSECPSCGGDTNAKPGCGQNCKRCSNYKKGPVPCPKICKINGCDCKPDFIYDDNTGKCVHPSKCTPVCRANEIYVQCPDISKPQKCSQLGFPLPIPAESPDGKCPGKPSCVCIEGHLRNSEGICVPQSECPSCGGDSNAKPGCGQHCKRCSNYKKGSVPCPAICKINGCDCKPDFIFDDNTGKCVHPSKCTQVCNANETYNRCPSISKPQNCSQLGYPLPLPKSNAGGQCQTKPACVCKKEGHVKNDEGICVPTNECPSCGGDPNAKVGCGTNCGRRCSNYKNNTIICPLGCSYNSCMCKPEFVYDDNIRKCVFPHECTPVCGKHEVFSDCTNGYCFGARNCTEKGKIKKCVKIDPKYCKKGCICKEGYLWNKNGDCVPEDKCETDQCGGDPNAVPIEGCGSGCRKTCSNYNQTGPVICPAVCRTGCDCKHGFVYDNNLQKCVRPTDCSPVCGPNEEYSSCANGGCYGPRKCSETGGPTICVDLLEGGCIGGCLCKKGFMRNDKDVCVPEKECRGHCGSNEIFSNCTQGLCRNELCSQKENPIACIALADYNCQKGCVCQLNYLRDENGNCIPENECDSKNKCPRPNEYYDMCPPSCSPQLCDKSVQIKCLPTAAVCKPACRCRKGYRRNSKGICVPEKECVKCTGPHEYFKCGVACDNVCENLSQQNQTNCPVKNKMCNEKCYCESGYARNKNNICVPFKDCEKDTCPGPNEYYDICPPPCSPQLCDKSIKIKCPSSSATVCKPACRCRKGYRRNSKGICVPEKECKPNSCNGDPNAEPGCGTNCGRRCSNYKRKNIACILICYENGCDCKKGYVFDDNLGKCVLPEDCTPVCDRNEVYSNCTQGVCRNQYCSQKGKPVACPRLHPGSCTQGCVCKEKYMRAKNGTCIPEDKCEEPTSCKGDPNAVPGCGINCGRLCSNYDSPDPIMCLQKCLVDGCDCKEGYVLDTKIGKCVLPKDCSKCKKPHEYYDPCPNKCSKHTCDDIIGAGNTKKSSPHNEPCIAGCRCVPGYYKNKIGECISEDDCFKCTGPHEYFTCGGACDNVCANLTQQNQTHCPIRNIDCNRKCYCESGYARNKNNICVPFEDCENDKCPGPNEYYDCCPPPCSPQLCDKSIKIKCPSSSATACKPACRCLKGYRRNSKGICVPEKECKPKSCNGDPNAEPGCGINCGRRCSNYKRKDIACIQVCYENGCDCKKDYVFDDNLGKCVRPEDCTPVCGRNEVFSNCTQGECRNQYCSQKGKPVACPRLRPGSCTQGCVCKEKYLRAKNGTCIPEDKCEEPTSCKGDPNAVPGCGINCGRLCSNYDSPDPVVCSQNCLEDGCDCKEGYVLDTITEKCVRPEDCCEGDVED